MTRKGNAGGRHIAMERGLRQGRCGWPFPRPGAVGARPMQAVGQPANPEADGATRARVGAKEGHCSAADAARGKSWDLAFHFWRRVDWSQKVSS
jgi:hypothetical protein